jgi:hypothetical protein
MISEYPASTKMLDFPGTSNARPPTCSGAERREEGRLANAAGAETL